MTDDDKLHLPWNHEELAQMKRNLRTLEAEHPDARPLPPLAEEETRQIIDGLLNAAAERPLTPAECFLFGQLLAQYRQAIQAAMLGKRGRYYVITEADLARYRKQS